MVARCAAARSRVHPGFKRPKTLNHHSVPASIRPFLSSLNVASAHTGRMTSKRRPTSRPKNSGGVTPTISAVWPLSVSVCPTAPGSPPNVALPERVAQEHPRRAPGTVVRRTQGASDERLHTKDVEELAARPEARRRTNLAAGRQVEAIHAPREDARERLLPRRDLAPDGIRDRRVPRLEAAARAGHVDDVNVDEAAGIRHRQRAQPYGVYNLEECGVRPDAQRQGHDGDDRKPGIPRKDTDRVARILDEMFQPSPAPDVARGFLNLSHVAEIAPRLRYRVASRRAARDVVLGCEVEMRPDLGVEIVASAPPAEEGHDRYLAQGSRQSISMGEECLQPSAGSGFGVRAIVSRPQVCWLLLR